MTGRLPRVWVLLGHRTGDNNQLLALAEALGLPFETRTLRFNLCRLFGRLAGSSLVSLTRASRRAMAPPWPDLVLGIGWRSVPVARWLRRVSGGRAKLVRLGDPRADPKDFDLIVTTPQYAVADAVNVLRLPMGMSRFKRPPTPTEEEQDYLARLPRPHHLLAVGGPAKFWRLSAATVQSAAETLAGKVKGQGGSLVIVTSPRTPADLTAALQSFAMKQSNCSLVQGRMPRFAILLADADAAFVTGDSIAMLSEAVLAGKPVGIVPVEADERGRRTLGEDGGGHRDLRRFWASLTERGLAGTIDHPVRGQVNDPAITAAAAIRDLLGDGVE